MATLGEDDMFFTGCIYNDEPDDDFYKLTPDDLKNMRLIGLPIRVEHHDTDTGEVVDSWVSDEGKAFVRWRFSDDPRGWALSKLVRDGRVCELSLKHAEFEDGSKEAMEVSVVERGARPRTFIHRGQPVKYICASLRFKDDPMATAEDSRLYKRNHDGTFAEVSATVAAAAPPPENTTPDAPPQAEEAPKRPAETEQLDPRRAKVAKLAEVAEKLLPLISDHDLSSSLVGSISDIIQATMEQENVITTLKQQNTSMVAESEKIKSRDKTLAREIVDGITSLWGDLTLPAMDDDKKNVMLRVYEQNPDFAHASQQLIVAASKVGAMKQAISGAEQKTQLQTMQDLLRKAQAQIGAIGHMQGAPPTTAPAPSWVPVSAPVVTAVAASAKEHPPPAPAPAGFAMPDILNNLPSFTGVVGNVRPSDIYTSRQ